MADRVQPLARVRHGDLALAEVAAGQVGAGQVCAAEAGAAHVGPRQHRVPQVGPAEGAAEQVGAGHPRARHPASVEDGPGEVGVGQLAPAQVETGEVGEPQRQPLAAALAGDEPQMARQHDVEFRLAQPPAAGRGLLHRHAVRSLMPQAAKLSREGCSPG